MADFCNQCARELGFPEGDFARPDMSPPEEGMVTQNSVKAVVHAMLMKKAIVMILTVIRSMA